jgi:acetyl esterase/lipase
MMLRGILHTLRHRFRPLIVALFYRDIAWDLRWRLLLFQPGVFIAYSLHSLRYLFSSPFTVEYWPITPEQTIRVLVYKSPGTGKGRSLRPIHVDVHSGAFMGGMPETSTPFASRVARETGAVVLSITHRCAPEHVFPAAIDDIDAAIRYIQDNAARKWGADPTLLTVGGFSAGGNLTLAATQQPNCHAPSPTAIKGYVSFYAPIDLRLSPGQKPAHRSLPKNDPSSVLFPLFDSYATEARKEHFDDPRLSPALAARETLPERMLLVVATIDITPAELLSFANRVNEEDKVDGNRDKPRVEVFEEESFHGYLERKFSPQLCQFCIVINRFRQFRI